MAVVAMFVVLLATTGSAADDVAPAGQEQASTSAISYKKARKILINKVIKPKRLAADDDLIAFGSKRPLKAKTKISPYRGRGPSLTTKRPTWFFWIDDDPKAQFEHSSRFVFIDVRTGRTKVKNHTWWPLIQGRAPWFKPDDYWNPKQWVYSTVKPIAPAASIASSPQVRAAASTAECAVIIDGSGDVKAGFPEDVEGMNGVIGTTFGYTTKKLTPPNNNKADFEAAVDELVKDGCRDMLIYIASHGGKEQVDMGTGTYTAADLKALMEKYPTMEFKVVIQGCKAGSWIGKLGAGTLITITSTDADKPSYSADPDGPDDPNPDDKGSEFTSGLIEDLKEIPGSQTLMQRLQDCIRAGKPILVCKLEIAFESALAKDEDAKGGKAAPQRSP